MNIGSRLKQILEERDMNVSQLSREAEVPAQTLYAMIKRDSNKVDMNIMARILEALEMDLMEFLQMEPRKRRLPGTLKKEKNSTDKTKKAEEMERKSEEKEEKEVKTERPVRQEIEDYLL